MASAALGSHFSVCGIAGFLLYPPETAIPQTQAFLDEALAGVRASGLTASMISSGGTPNLVNLGKIEGATEHRAGTYVFNDRMMMACGAATLEEAFMSLTEDAVEYKQAAQAGVAV